MAYNYQRARSVAHRLISKYGEQCVLRRSSGDRTCTAVEIEFNPDERAAGLVGITDRLFLISTVDLSLAPNKDRDLLITFAEDGVTESERLRMVRPPIRLQPARTNVYWEIAVTGAIGNA